jgi:hypothetical protein
LCVCFAFLFAFDVSRVFLGNCVVTREAPERLQYWGCRRLRSGSSAGIQQQLEGAAPGERFLLGFSRERGTASTWLVSIDKVSTDQQQNM